MDEILNILTVGNETDLQHSEEIKPIHSKKNSDEKSSSEDDQKKQWKVRLKESTATEVQSEQTACDQDLTFRISVIPSRESGKVKGSSVRLPVPSQMNADVPVRSLCPTIHIRKRTQISAELETRPNAVELTYSPKRYRPIKPKIRRLDIQPKGIEGNQPYIANDNLNQNGVLPVKGVTSVSHYSPLPQNPESKNSEGKTVRTYSNPLKECVKNINLSPSKFVAEDASDIFQLPNISSHEDLQIYDCQKPYSQFYSTDTHILSNLEIPLSQDQEVNTSLTGQTSANTNKTKSDNVLSLTNKNQTEEITYVEEVKNVFTASKENEKSKALKGNKKPYSISEISLENDIDNFKSHVLNNKVVSQECTSNSTTEIIDNRSNFLPALAVHPVTEKSSIQHKRKLKSYVLCAAVSHKRTKIGNNPYEFSVPNVIVKQSQEPINSSSEYPKRKSYKIVHISGRDDHRTFRLSTNFKCGNNVVCKSIEGIGLSSVNTPNSSKKFHNVSASQFLNLCPAKLSSIPGSHTEDSSVDRTVRSEEIVNPPEAGVITIDDSSNNSIETIDLEEEYSNSNEQEKEFTVNRTETSKSENGNSLSPERSNTEIVLPEKVNEIPKNYVHCRRLSMECSNSTNTAHTCKQQYSLHNSALKESVNSKEEVEQSLMVRSKKCPAQRSKISRRSLSFRSRKNRKSLSQSRNVCANDTSTDWLPTRKHRPGKPSNSTLQTAHASKGTRSSVKRKVADNPNEAAVMPEEIFDVIVTQFEACSEQLKVSCEEIIRSFNILFERPISIHEGCLRLFPTKPRSNNNQILTSYMVDILQEVCEKIINVTNFFISVICRVLNTESDQVLLDVCLKPLEKIIISTTLVIDYSVHLREVLTKYVPTEVVICKLKWVFRRVRSVCNLLSILCHLLQEGYNKNLAKHSADQTLRNLFQVLRQLKVIIGRLDLIENGRS